MSKFTALVVPDEELDTYLQGKGYIGVMHNARPYHNILTTKAALLGMATAEDLKAYLDGFPQATFSLFGAPADSQVAVIETEMEIPEQGNQVLLVYFDGDVFSIACASTNDVEEGEEEEITALRANPVELDDLFEQIKAL